MIIKLRKYGDRREFISYCILPRFYDDKMYWFERVIVKQRLWSGTWYSFAETFGFLVWKTLDIIPCKGIHIL